MGIPISVLGKLGLPGVDSLSTDQVYIKYFKDKKIETYEDFLVAFLSLCNDFNAIMPGKHYKIKATREEVKVFFDNEWLKVKETEQQQKRRKDLLVEFMKKHVEEYKTSSSAMIWVGATAPGAAVLLKKSGEKVPQVKKLRMDLVPNFVFVPTVTMISLIAVRMLNVTRASRPTS